MNSLDELYRIHSQSPNAPLFANLKALDIEPTTLAVEDPLLLQYAMGLFNTDLDPKKIKIWKYINKAYSRLKEKKLLEVPTLAPSIIDEMTKELVTIANGPTRIPREELEQCLIVLERRGVRSYQFNFFALTHLIERYYGINVRDFFDCQGWSGRYVQEKLHCSDAEYLQWREEATVKAYEIHILEDAYEAVNAMPYLDFWHYLLDYDFINVINGSVETLWREEQSDADESGLFDKTVVKTIRQLYFKEIGKLSIFEKPPESIACWMAW